MKIIGLTIFFVAIAVAIMLPFIVGAQGLIGSVALLYGIGEMKLDKYL